MLTSTRTLPPAIELDAALTTARLQGRAALLGYLPVGYPSLTASIDALTELAGICDVVEVGLPYSDPIMDGAPIQAANEAALRAGTRIAHVFEAVRAVTAAGGTAVVMSYCAPVLRYGQERFADDLADAGGAGVILPDLPVLESGRWRTAARTRGLHTVNVAAPNVDDARLSWISAASSGFLYLPASRSPTGGQGPLDQGLGGFINRVRHFTDLPLCAGIGVHNAASAAAAAEIADGVIVGSAFVRKFLADPTHRGVTAIADLAAELAQAVRTHMPTPPPDVLGIAHPRQAATDVRARHHGAQHRHAQLA